MRQHDITLPVQPMGNRRWLYMDRKTLNRMDRPDTGTAGSMLELIHNGHVMAKKLSNGLNHSTLVRYRREMALQVRLDPKECSLCILLPSRSNEVEPGEITPEEGSPRYYSQTINTPAAGDAA